MIALTLIRHAATSLNDDRRYQGQCDPDLSRRGVSQAKALGRRLAEHGAVVDSVWASDRRRAWRTALIALPRVVVRQDARLRELDFGMFDGLTYDENVARHAHLFPAWVADPWHIRPPCGETLAELTTRLEAWIEELPSGQHALAVTHGGPIHVMLARALSVSFAEAQRIPVGPCGVVRLRWNSGGTPLRLAGALEEQPWP